MTSFAVVKSHAQDMFCRVFVTWRVCNLSPRTECPASKTIRPTELSGLRPFRDDHPDARLVCVADIDQPFNVGDIDCFPWRSFFDQVAG
jgi:hypothetical protein